MAGKHSVHSKKTNTFRKAAIALLSATTILVLTPSMAFSGEEILESIAQCESGNRNVPTGITKSDGSRASSATGYLQIIKGTWIAYGGGEFAPRAMDATREEQFIVGARILKGQGLGAWSESQHCWGKKNSVKTSITVTKSHVVKEGDTLSKIATKYGTTWQNLYELNQDIVKNPNVIFPSATLKLR